MIMVDIMIKINGETHVFTRDVGLIFLDKDCTERCSLVSVCCKLRHFEKQKQTHERKNINIKYSMEVDGKRHVLVKDPEGKNGFFSCKACSLREKCHVGELLCLEILGDSRRDRFDYHFEQIDLPNAIKP